MHNPFAHHLMTDAHPTPRNDQSLTANPTPGLYTGHGSLWYDQFESAVLAEPSQALVCLLTDRTQDTEKPCQLMVTTTQQQPEYPSVINIILILNTKHSTLPATMEEN